MHITPTMPEWGRLKGGHAVAKSRRSYVLVNNGPKAMSP